MRVAVSTVLAGMSLCVLSSCDDGRGPQRQKRRYLIEVEYSTPRGDGVAKGSFDVWLQPITGPMGQRRRVTLNGTAIPIFNESGMIVMMTLAGAAHDMPSVAPWVTRSDQNALEAGQRVAMDPVLSPGFVLYRNPSGAGDPYLFTSLNSKSALDQGYAIKGMYVSRTEESISFDARKWLPWAYNDFDYSVRNCTASVRPSPHNNCVSKMYFKR